MENPNFIKWTNPLHFEIKGCWVCVLGQVWCLIVSTSDICPLSNFDSFNFIQILKVPLVSSQDTEPLNCGP